MFPPNSRGFVNLYLLVLHLKVLHVLLLPAAAPHFLNDEEIKCTYHHCCQQGLSLTLLNTCLSKRLLTQSQLTDVQITVKLLLHLLLIVKEIYQFTTRIIQTHICMKS